MYRNGLLFCLVVTLVISAGCATKKVQEETALTPPPAQTLTPPVNTPPPVAVVERRVADETVADKPQVVVAPLPAAALRSVPFEYDQHLLSDTARDILAANAAILKAQGRLRVTLAGYCDERGADQYNIALGERRAESVRNYLLSLGISEGRLEAVSYGEEKPLDAGHDEAAWVKNRRVELVPMS
jgi:peptidoglycan-associated lipoprotein